MCEVPPKPGPDPLSHHKDGNEARPTLTINGDGGWETINSFLDKLVRSIACLAHAADVHACALHTCACLLMSHPRDPSSLTTFKFQSKFH